MENLNVNDVYIVAGATGRCGRFITKSLLLKNKKTIILVRSEVKVQEVFDSTEINKFEKIVYCDLIKQEDYEKKVDQCFSCPNTNYYVISCLRYQFESIRKSSEGNFIINKRLIDASVKSSKVKKYCLVSSSHVRRPYSWVSVTNNMNGKWISYYKAIVEDYLRLSGLVYLIVRPTSLVMNENPTAFVISQGDRINNGKIHVSTIGKLTVDSLLDPWIPCNSSYECFSTNEQMKNLTPYQYSQGYYRIKAETEQEKKYVNHVFPIRIIQFFALGGFTLLLNGFLGYFRIISWWRVLNYLRRLVGLRNSKSFAK